MEKRHELQQNPISWPTKKYSTIVVDPPWEMVKIERDIAPNQTGFDYPTMTINQIKSLRVPELFMENAFVFLWATQKYFRPGIEILEHWGLKFRFHMTWVKPGGFQVHNTPMGNGEYVLVGAKGNPKFVDLKAFKMCFNAPRGKHSEKPDTFYELIERTTGGNRIDLFARKKRSGFVSWGNEIKKEMCFQPLLPNIN